MALKDGIPALNSYIPDRAVTKHGTVITETQRLKTLRRQISPIYGIIGIDEVAKDMLTHTKKTKFDLID